MAEVLTEAAERTGALSLRGEILMQVASICEELLNDRTRAERVYRRVLVLDEADAELVLPAARALERIYLASAEHAKLAEMLRIQVKLEQDGALRATLFGRLGELCQNVLSDNDGAIAAWKARVEENPDDEQALAALDRLYELTERYRELVSVLERRREISSDGELRRGLMTRSAETLWKKLEAVPEAIEAYQALIAEFGPNGASLSALEALFGNASHWDELSETLERHLDVAESDSERLSLFAKLGDLKRDHLSDVSGALLVYRRALALDTRHAPSRLALGAPARCGGAGAASRSRADSASDLRVRVGLRAFAARARNRGAVQRRCAGKDRRIRSGDAHGGDLAGRFEARLRLRRASGARVGRAQPARTVASCTWSAWPLRPASRPSTSSFCAKSCPRSSTVKCSSRSP